MAESIWKTSDIAATGPLAGVRILDMSSVVMGPLATLMLADMGADVIKVENRGGSHSGDMMRYAGPSPTGDLGPIFMALNRNKKAVTIDARDPVGSAQLAALLKEADVFFHNVRMAGMQRLGLDYDSVKKINPGIIYIHCCGFGAEGPYGKRQAYDDLVQAASGWADLYAKRSNGPPAYTPSLVADKTVGLFATTATLAALVHKERTGQGQFVSVPMLECFTFFNMVENLYGQTFPGNGKLGYTRSINPRRRPYPTRDGFIAIVPYVDRQWERFFEIGGRPGVFQDPRFSTYEERTKHTGDLYAIIEEVAATKTTDEWVELLDREDIPAMRFNRIEDVLDDPHLKATGFFMDMEAPHIGAYRTLRHPIAFGGSPVNQRLAPQRVGAQNDELPLPAND